MEKNSGPWAARAPGVKSQEQVRNAKGRATQAGCRRREIERGVATEPLNSTGIWPDRLLTCGPWGEAFVKKTALIAAVFSVFGLLSAGKCFAQSKPIDPLARKFIDAGNQAWVDGMKSGQVGGVAAVFAADALDCGATGECLKGRAAIEASLKARVARFGRAQSASVSSSGAVERGDFVYEWGSSKAEYAGGRTLGGSYLTVWRHEPDGTWKIFRNMGIPASAHR